MDHTTPGKQQVHPGRSFAWFGDTNRGLIEPMILRS
jgi:hypothetical protein